MGWGNCGTDSEDRPIGYNFEATCDHPGCDEEIDRGLAYVCGDMHGGDEYSCEKYFCEKHRSCGVETDQGHLIMVCAECEKTLLETGEWYEDENEGLLRPLKRIPADNNQRFTLGDLKL